MKLRMTTRTTQPPAGGKENRLRIVKLEERIAPTGCACLCNPCGLLNPQVDVQASINVCGISAKAGLWVH